MTPDMTDLAAAYALDALEADEAAAFEAAVAADAELAAEVARLQATVTMLAGADTELGRGPDADLSAEPPPHLVDRVLAAALSARPAARSDAPGRAAPASPAVALGHSVAAFIEAARATDDRGWAAPTGLGLTVGDLVAHLGGAFDYVAAILGASDAAVASGPEVDHHSYTAPAVEAARALDRAAVTERTAASLQRLADWAAAAGPDLLGGLVPYEGGEVPAFLPLVARAFEAWAHGEHLRRATGQPPWAPPPGDLALLCDAAVAAIPMTWARQGRAASGRALRLVLVGPGGGTYLVGDGGPPPAPDAPDAPDAPTIDAAVVMEALDLCRVTGGLVEVAEAIVEAEGDRAFAEALIGSLAVLAE